LKAFTGFNIRSDQIEKVDSLKIKRGTNRSEALRHIIDEYFKSGNMDLIDALESIKRQNRDLKYQLDHLKNVLIEQNEQALAMLLLLGGRDEKFKREVRKRFPQFWQK
jgi:hypothetical protein